MQRRETNELNQAYLQIYATAAERFCLLFFLEHRPPTLHIFQSRDDVIDGRQPFKDRDEWKELRIMHIVEPTGHGNLDNKERDLMSNADSNTYGIILMEYVGDWRIVDDNHFANITTQPTEIFDVIPWKVAWKFSIDLRASL